jgi:hypothetical protein
MALVAFVQFPKLTRDVFAEYDTGVARKVNLAVWAARDQLYPGAKLIVMDSDDAAHKESLRQYRELDNALRDPDVDVDD